MYKVFYGAKVKIFDTIEKARAFRAKKRKKYYDIVIRITDEDGIL
jgi:hypothetical protein